MKFRAFKDSSEIGMKPRLTQTLIDYHPSAPNFSAIRTKSAREEASVLSHHVAALNFDGGLPRAEFPRVRCRDRRQSNSSTTFTLPSNRNTSFQHQQFQEWYASFDAPALMCAAAAGDPYQDRSRLRRCSFACSMRQVTLGYQARLNGIMATLRMNSLCPQQNGFRLLHTLGMSNRRRD